jgi:hypothetical protein
MMRRLLFELLIFMLPFVGFMIWRRAQILRGRPAPTWPWLMLVGVGFVLVAGSVAFEALTGRHEGQIYVPSEVQADGTVVPGHYVPKPALPTSPPESPPK